MTVQMFPYGGLDGSSSTVEAAHLHMPPRKYETRARIEVVDDIQDVRERMKAARESGDASPSVREALKIELAALENEWRMMDELEERGIEIPTLTPKQQEAKYRRDLRAQRKQEKQQREREQQIADEERREEEEYQREKAAKLARKEAAAESHPEPPEDWSKRVKKEWDEGTLDRQAFWEEVGRRHLDEQQVRQVLGLTPDDPTPAKTRPLIIQRRAPNPNLEKALARQAKRDAERDAPDPIFVRH